MTLIPTINVCIKSACTQLAFYDTTGIYNSMTNPNGYGSPNPATTDFSIALLQIITPDNTIYTIDLKELSAGFPNSNEEFSYIIPPSQIGNRTVIEDGFWQFLYTIETSIGVTYVATKTSIFTCNTRCCVNKMLLLIDPEKSFDDRTNTKRINDYLQAKAFLDALVNYAYCGNVDKVNNIKLIVDKLCSRSGCKSCN